MKTIALPEEIYKELINLKLQEGNKTAAELIDKLIINHKKRKFLEASNLFMNKLNKKKLNFQKLTAKSKKIRGEVVDEWF